MWGRALIFAAGVVAVASFAAGPADAQNLEAGKSPSQIFAGGCAACHKSPRGLLKTVSPSALPGFLRQHYTTSSDMASLLASYLVSNGASDTRYQAKPGAKGVKQQEAARPAAAADQPPERSSRGLFSWFSSEPQQAAKPDADGLNPEGETGHRHKGKRRKAGQQAKDAVPSAPKEAGSNGPAPSAPGAAEPSAPPADTPAAR